MLTGINVCIPVVSLGQSGRRIIGLGWCHRKQLGSPGYSFEFSGVCCACGSQPLCPSMGAVPGLAQACVLTRHR